jgi:hypothetical protein
VEPERSLGVPRDSAQGSVKAPTHPTGFAAKAVEERRLHTTKAGGSSPSLLTIFTWNKPLGLSECPYLRLWMIDFGLFAIRLHHWLGSDDKRHFHDHGWWFLTFMLWGSYTDISPNGQDTLRTGFIRFRKATHRHTVVVNRPSWTLLITGRPSRRWGFWVGNKLMKRDRYFAEYGHHPCDPNGEPIRMNPEGKRV